MADILQFKKKKLSDRHKGKTLCKNGFHKWKIVQQKPFDSRQGKLVSIYRCERCGKQKVTRS